MDFCKYCSYQIKNNVFPICGHKSNMVIYAYTHTGEPLKLMFYCINRNPDGDCIWFEPAFTNPIYQLEYRLDKILNKGEIELTNNLKRINRKTARKMFRRQYARSKGYHKAFKDFQFIRSSGEIDKGDPVSIDATGFAVSSKQNTDILYEDDVRIC